MKIIVVAALIAAGILSWRVHSSEKRQQQSLVSSASLRDSIQLLIVEKEVMQASLALRSRVEWGGSAILEGTLAGTDSTMRFGVVDVDIVYVLDESCAACEQNLPLLDSLAAEGTKVVALSRHGASSSLAEYALKHRLRFPLLAYPSGALVKELPSPVTPISFLVSRDRVRALHVGRLSGGAVRMELGDN
jgi:hypothetical protein